MKMRKMAAFLAVAALVAACGNGEDPAEDTPETPDSETPTEEPEASADDEVDEPADDDRADWPDSLTMTLQPAENPEALIEDAQVLGDMLSEKLGVEVEAEVPTDYQAVIVGLQTGQADIGGGFGPVNVARAMDQAGAEPILQAERFGEFLYVTQWFTNDPDTFCADEPVEEIYEADGEEYVMLFCNGVNELETSEDGPVGTEMLEHAGDVTISFVSQGSASGEVFPAFGLIEMGYELDELDTMYAGGHPESVLAVANGDATIGVSYNDAREDLVAEIPDIGEQVVVFAWSDPIPNDGFVIRGDLPQSLKDAVTDALLEIAEDETQGQVLLDLYTIDGFRPADPADFDVARQVDQQLGELLG